MLDSTTKDGGLSEANSAAGDSLWDLVPRHPAYMGGWAVRISPRKSACRRLFGQDSRGRV